MKKSIASGVAVLALAGAAYAGSGKSDVIKKLTIIIIRGIKTPPIVKLPVTVPAPIPMPTPTPAPVMPPMMPSPSGTSVLAPSLAGIAAVSSGINVADYLMKAGGTGELPSPEPGGGQGAFRFLCAPSHNAYDDPIVYPGQPGKSHLHTFFGNSQANANSTYASLRTSGDSTCNNLLNRSAYWIPALMNGRGKVVMPDYLSVYYKRSASTDKVCTMSGGSCLPLPRGLRYIFGYNMSNPANGSGFYWNCDGAGAVSGHFANIAQAAKGCPAGSRLGAVLSAPDCWNGKELDTADHRSHMAFKGQDGYGHDICPKTHPYVLPQFTLGAWYTTDATLDRSGDESASANTWFLASDRMQGMANSVPGSTFHADWFGAWEDSVMALWMANCIEKELSCTSGDLGQGQQIKNTFGYTFGNTTQLIDPPAN